MHHLSRASAVCLLALLFVAFAAAQEPKEGDFPSWNTWKIACKGDWVEYAIGDKGVKSAGVKYEILDVVEGVIKYTRTTFDDKGKETLSQPQNRVWNKVRLWFTPPTNQKVEWRDDTCEIVGVKLKCRVASWKVPKDAAEGGGDLVTEYWYSAELPCGGIVKVVSDNVASVWVTGFAFNGKSNRGEDGKPLTATDPMPKFFATAGNVAVYKLMQGGQVVSFQKRTVISADADTSKYQVVRCEADGASIAGAAPLDREQTRKEWHNRYAKTVEEKDQKVKVDAGTFTCNQYRETDMGTTTDTWIGDGVIVRMVSKDPKGVETTLELVKLTLK